MLCSLHICVTVYGTNHRHYCDLIPKQLYYIFQHVLSYEKELTKPETSYKRA